MNVSLLDPRLMVLAVVVILIARRGCFDVRPKTQDCYGGTEAQVWA